MSSNASARAIGIILATIAALSGCGSDGPSEAAVEQFGRGFFSALQSREFDRALTFYDDEFFKTRSREQWKSQLQDMQTRLGDLQAAELKRKQADLRYSGKFYIFEYRVTYAREVAWETVTLFVPNGRDEVRVFGHTIKAKGSERGQ